MTIRPPLACVTGHIAAPCNFKYGHCRHKTMRLLIQRICGIGHLLDQ